MEMIPVQSSNVKAVGYDAAARALVVQFCSGARWRYAEVDRAIFDELLAAPSVGRFVRQLVLRPAQHPATRLGADDAP